MNQRFQKFYTSFSILQITSDDDQLNLNTSIPFPSLNLLQIIPLELNRSFNFYKFSAVILGC
ncbi:uncharacterized protein MELLADRAFT_91915 [Melampsora larici-populina 98AG31]|uniref:Uncharacterized protein n=1 Tax=Melampsora larici-populina (strain 98AG31 / pathotype 3-4-7) TaxID=747676 RepID=F4S0V0_MELLP|nr:uncharacterized protein MELLADRAFT_91915 [Melampsora larici-populina 98AG31]EGG01653.1 hypothetical protein MELLADRAFT_91915 [Melampsora larici-populina 98AG31]